MQIHGPLTATWLFMNFILLENCCWSGLEFGSSLEHHLGTIEPIFEKKFQIKIQISKISKNSKIFKISRCENNEKWLLKLSFLVLISVKKRQVKSHLRSKPDFNIDLIHFHYHLVQKSSENGRFWPEIWKKFEISGNFMVILDIIRTLTEMISRKCGNLARFFDET